MVGIVIVSHSRQLALGVQSLIDQMVQGQVPIAIAAGVDDPENPLGTDAIEVMSAIASVHSDGGVLVLMDLGSALMSAEMALEFLPEEQRNKVFLCEAPLVEGAIAAAVAIAGGSNIEQAIAEARGALAAKAIQLNITAPQSDLQQLINDKQNTQEIRITVRNQLGMHARPAAQFVATVAKFQSQIQVRNLTRNTEFVRAESINQIATLAVRQGHELVITATGDDASQALSALQTLIENNFGENPPPPTPPISPTPHSPLPTPPTFSAIPASSGIAIARIKRYHHTSCFQHHVTSIEIPQYHVDNIECEFQRLESALIKARREVQTLLSETFTQIGDAEAAIFDAHLFFLEDPVVIEASKQRIESQKLNAEAAWQSVVDEWTNNYRNLDDAYLQARAADIIDVGQRVLRKLLDIANTKLDATEPIILVTTDLTPSDTAQLTSTQVVGICTTAGSATSHTAIIARGLGIPVVVGLPEAILHLADGTLLALDGDNGNLWVEPEANTLVELEQKRNTLLEANIRNAQAVNQPAITRDGRQINVFANISGIADGKVAMNLGAEGVGLLRTEFLFLHTRTAPSEEEQVVVYQEIANVLNGRTLIIRTLDVGGDKPLPYLDLPSEANPFLGWRGIRLCLAYSELFKTQLRAILRASVGNNIKIMFPMISTMEELRAAKTILADVQAELYSSGISFNSAIEVGIMIEVPSAVVIAQQLAAEVDFFSIGTNDLSQYIMACDRTNPRVASLADGFHPAVLRMIQQTVEAAHQAGISVGLCGEIANDPLAVPLLLGLGLDEVSLNPQAIPAFKQSISRLTQTQAQAIAHVALKQDCAAKVREFLS